ncbi:MAG: excinuclease ABC subunit UvrB [Deltaproteobacteria bacterium]|nr:excinuclease ABC subunit UvrB [Deltaproteobacteria bacterium]
MVFKLFSDFRPTGDQPKAIEFLSKGIEAEKPYQVLLGVTGSGKTFTIANVIERVVLPTLVIAPNKTLAAQLYSEFKTLFPENAVEFFVSYYDYYQPEAYLPATDTYIEKDAAINEEIDKMRHSATSSLLTRRDVIIVASVSCIYGLGSPSSYSAMLFPVKIGERIPRKELLHRLVDLQYLRNDFEFKRGRFRVRGDVIDIFPPSTDEQIIRLELWGDTVNMIAEVDPLRGVKIRDLESVIIFPGSHYVAPHATLRQAVAQIREELQQHLTAMRQQNKLVEAQRLENRTLRDLEMMEEMGFCPGIENYARHLDGRAPGESPYTLLDYFPKPYLTVIDESHLTIPQIGGMYRGDRSRKETLVDYGFRLPSALDNRPLSFQEFEKRVQTMICVSATPGEYEYRESRGSVVEQIIRPTGLMDPRIEVRPTPHQIDDLIGEVRICVKQGYRVLVTTLTKRMAEELTEYLKEAGIQASYLHADIDTLERVRIIRDLRLGHSDVLVGINLLREGLDLPEVALVAILDADKEGFLRSERSLIQTCGRTARNVDGRVLMYADTLTPSMKKAIQETERRRRIQEAYNTEHRITPQTIRKHVSDILASPAERDYVTVPLVAREEEVEFRNQQEVAEKIKSLKQEMIESAKGLHFERAIACRDEIRRIEEIYNKW